MTQPFPETQLSRLSEFVAEHTGLYFSKERWRELERGIIAASGELGFGDVEPCIDWLTSAPLTRSQIEILASHLTIGETYFFREKMSFEMLKDHILRTLIPSRQETDKRLRLWSAGCATGEEPYTLAMLLSDIVPDVRHWNITILATDINPRFLHKASEGVYSEWSFRDVPQSCKEKYFKRAKDGRYEILPRIKKMVTFSYLNLMENVYPSLLNNTNAMDVILCRNVLMYFQGQNQRKVIGNLYRSLTDKGWLIVGASEMSHVLFSQFDAGDQPGAPCYLKAERTVAVPEPKIKFDSLPTSPLSAAPERLVPERLNSKTPVRKETPHQTLLETAYSLYEQGSYEEAAVSVLNALSDNRKDSKALMLLAKSYANQGKLSEAIKWCEKAIAADKLNPSCHYLCATILQEQGLVEEGIKALRKALYADHNFVLAHFAIGHLMQRKGIPREAERHFENACSLLNLYEQDDILPESEGISAGRLKEMIRAIRT